MSLATSISGPKRLIRAASSSIGGQRTGRPALAVWICFYVLICGRVAIGVPSAAELKFAAHARQVFAQARKEYAAQPTNSEAAWKYARACFDTAEFATNNTERADLAEQGMAACRQLIAQDPKSAAAHYYLAMNLGQLARTRGLSALKLVNEMEKEFSLARGLDEQLDFAGPDRNLGLLYRDAPSLGSIGSRSKARKHLARATELAPDYPENRLNLVESDLKWSDVTAARHELKLLEDALPKARTNLVGENWASSWADWTPRFEEAKKKIETPPPSLDAHKRN